MQAFLEEMNKNLRKNVTDAASELTEMQVALLHRGTYNLH